MLNRWQYALLVVLAAAILALVVVNAFLADRNRRLQAEVASRGQFIQQTQQLQGLYQQIVRSLAELSARQNDEQLKDLLASHGITFTVKPPAEAPAGKK